MTQLPATPLPPRPSSAGVAPRLLLAIALLTPSIPNFIYFFTVGPRGYWLGQIVTSLLLITGLVLVGLKVRTTLLVLSPFAIAAPFASAYALATGYVPSVLALQVLCEATVEELANFLPAILICTGLAVLVAFLYWRTAAKWRSAQLPIDRRVRAVGLGLLFLALGKDIAVSGPRQGGSILLARLEAMQPTSPLALAVHLELYGGAVADRTGVLQHYVVKQSPPNSAREICVLVLGESARKRAFGLYNPQLDTTPLLRTRDLIVFADAKSCGTATIQSVPILMTGQFPDRGEILPFRHLGLIEAFRLAGFHTSWFSTQEADGAISSFITAFSKNAEEKKFLNGRVERSRWRNPALKDDGALLDPLAAAIAAHPGKLFIVLHTLGSHMPYLKRYPATFEKWPVAARAKEEMWRWAPPFDEFQRRQIDQAYLNTVLYTDWFLNQVIEKLGQSGGISSLIYLGDHGENDASAPQMPGGHAVLTDDVINIPMFIWLSPAFRSARPALAQSLAVNARKHVSAQDLFATVCALHGIETDEADPTRNLASNGYQEHERRVLLLDGHVVTLAPNAATASSAP